eukprot:scaffold6403_cov128-Skeletonema_dohrnii-CCMP3373.AAC.10
MSSPSNAVADIGILANGHRPNDDGSTVNEPEIIITSRRDVYGSMAHGTDLCGNCCFGDIADGSTTSPVLPPIVGLRISGVGNVPLPISDEHAGKIKSGIANEEKGGKKISSLYEIEGNVPLPISDHHASEIKKRVISEEEGSGEVYEIDASQIKVQNPQFNESLGNLLDTVAYKLGVNPGHLSARPKKLIYMEKGGYINRRRDDDKDGNVLGSLIIQLPSQFTGGELTIYNSSVEDDKDEESFKFTLGAGEEATYSCHFACHFSDCEYEMAKLRSGSRLLLCYSLRYKEVDQMPTAGLITETISPLTCSLGGLPPADRIIVIPLDKEYRIHSLANSGINALSRAHRQKAEALKAAGTDWELRIVNAKLEHTCSFWDDCDNNSSVIGIYDEIGKCVTEEMSWLTKAVDFDCVAHDGMMLAAHDEDECVSNWGACKSERRSCYDSDIYEATFLVSYDPAFETELRCLGGCEEVAEVSEMVVNAQDYALLDRVLGVIDSKEKSKFDVKSCQILLQMLTASTKNAQSLVVLVNKVLGGLSSSEEPDGQLYNVIIDAVDKLGHAELRESIEQLFAEVKRKEHKDICFFLRRMDFAFKLNKRIEEGDPNYLEAAINDLNEHGHGRAVLDSAAVVTSIVNMISHHKRQRHGLSSVVQASLTFLHNVPLTSKSLPLLVDRTHLLKHLLDQKMFGSLQTPLAEFVADFIRGLRLVIEHSTDCNALETKLKGDGKHIYIQAAAFLIKYGTQNDWDGFGKQIIKKKSIFSALTEAIISDDVDGKRLLRDILNKCLLQNYISYHNSDWIRGLKFEPRNATLHVQKVLELCPSVAQMVDKDKRLPLHHAATSSVQSYNASFEVVMRVFNAYKPAASIRDPITKLYPFQLAASNRNYKASFSLLLENPNLVSSAINGTKGRGRKRKRMRKSSA